MKQTSVLPSPTRVDPAVVAFRNVIAQSVRLVEAIELLDEAGGPGRAVAVGDEARDLRRAVGAIRETRDGLSRTLGRLAGLVRDGAVAVG